MCRTQTFCNSGRRRRTGPILILEPGLFIQKRTKNGSIILEPILFAQKRAENGSTLETKRTKNGSIILEPILFVQKTTKNGSTLEKKTGGRKNGTNPNPVAKLICQGQEKKVIIVSTVQSSPEYVSMDSQYKLGFLFNSKRFNLGMRTENVRIMWTNQIQV